MRGESEPEVADVEPPSSTNPSSSSKPSSESHPHSLKTLKQRQLARVKTAKRRKEADSEDDYKSPVKVEKTKSKRSSSRSGRAASVKPNTSAYGNVTDDGGKCPKYLYGKKQEASDSDTFLKDKEDDKESHSDSFTDS